MPTPVNSSYGSGSTKSFTTNDIVWQGPDIPCLNLCQGEKISDTMAKIANKICEIQQEFDLSDFDFKCLIDACDSCPEPERNVLAVLKLLRDGYCELKEAISKLTPNDPGSDDSFLDVNMRCLAAVNGAGEILNNKREKDIIQSIIDRVCTHDADISLLKSKTDNLQDQIDNLDLTPTVSLPSVTGCNFSGSRPLDQAVNAVDQALCTLKDLIGSSSEINQAISQLGQVPNMQTNPAWYAVVNNMARLLNNLVLMAMSHESRIGAIESTCCAPSCDDIRVGCIPEFDFANRLVTLRFTAGAGTNIPPQFEDAGSTISIIDRNGLSVSVTTGGDNIIGNDSSVDDINISGLAYGRLTIKFSTSFVLKDSNGAIVLRCSDCFSQEVEYSGGCCDIKNEGTEPVTILYTTC